MTTESNKVYQTIAQYAQDHGVELSRIDLRALSREAKALSEDMGYEIRHELDERYGMLNAFHQHILDGAFSEYQPKEKKETPNEKI